MRFAKGAGFWRATILIYIVLIFILSILRTNTGTHFIWSFRLDLVLHALEYFILSWLLIKYLEVSGRLKNWWYGLMLVLVFCGLIGGLNEILQIWIPDRFADIGDVAADLTGAVAAILFVGLSKLVKRLIIK